jgi:hypothetical protein
LASLWVIRRSLAMLFLDLRSLIFLGRAMVDSFSEPGVRSLYKLL